MQGTIVTATPACSSPQLIDPNVPLEISVSVTGRVNFDWSLIRMSAAKNSFHVAKKVNRAVVITPGSATGSITRRMAPSGPQPSISAASSNVLGTAENELRIRNNPNGRLNVVYTRPRPSSVFCRPRSFSTMYSGVMIAWKGIMNVARVAKNTRLLPGKRSFAKA